MDEVPLEKYGNAYGYQDLIEGMLYEREEVADVEIHDNSFDVCFHLDYCPNLEKVEEFQDGEVLETFLNPKERINADMVKRLKEMLPIGTVVQLEEMEGEPDTGRWLSHLLVYASYMPSGLRGTVTDIDCMCNINIDWDNDRTLSLNPFIDTFYKVTQKEENEINQNEIDQNNNQQQM